MVCALNASHADQSRSDKLPGDVELMIRLGGKGDPVNEEVIETPDGQSQGAD
jgi:hypothetical protein